MLNLKSDDRSLAEELPYWEFNDDPFPHVVLIDGGLVAGVELSLADIECANESAINQLTLGLRNLLNSLSEGVAVQFFFTVSSDFADVIESHTNRKLLDSHPLVLKMAEHRERSLAKAMANRELYRPRLFVFLKTKPVGQSKSSIFKRRVLSFLDEAASNYDQTLQELSQNLDALNAGFQMSGLIAKPLSKQEITERIYAFLNPARSREIVAPSVVPPQDDSLATELIEQVPWLADSSPREQLTFGDLILGFESFTLDHHLHKVITLKTLPEATFAGQLDGFLRLPFHYDLLLTFEKPEQSSEMAKLQQKRKMAHSLAVTHGGRASDLESESKLSSTEELIRELLATGQHIFAGQMTMILRASNTADGASTLKRQTREVLSRLRTLQGAEGLEETVGAWKIAKGNLPAAPVSLERARKMKTNNLADFLPVYGPREGDPDPVVIFRNRLNGLVSYDGFDSSLTNFNVLVTGSSGAGKSFLNNCILLQQIARGLRVFIIDIGGSYRKLTEALGGQYVDVNLNQAQKLNPFHLNDPSEEASGEKVKSVLAVVECMVIENESSALPKLDRVLLEKAIADLFSRKRSTGEIPTLTDLEGDLLNSNETSMNAIGKMLYTWTGTRAYGKLLDGQGSFATQNSICTFDLKGLSNYPDLQRVMILILMDFISSAISQDKTRRKKVNIDEAWELLKFRAAADQMEAFARKLRKDDAGITFLTQGLDELLLSPVGAPILNCTATKILLLQQGDLAQVAKTVGLTAHQTNLVRSLQRKKGEFSEALLIEGSHKQVIRICPSPIEYWLSTSDPLDNRELDRIRGEGLSLVEAIEKAAELHPNGVQPAA